MLQKTMETLAYLHLALANEAPPETDYAASISIWKTQKFFAQFNQQKLSTRAAFHLLSLTVALSILGMATQASALIQEGDRGSEVNALQQRLQQLGYFKANVTGFFGPMTKEAVIRFQQAKGLTPDGVVGTNTEASLGVSSNPRRQPVKQSSNPRQQPVRQSSNSRQQPVKQSSNPRQQPVRQSSNSRQQPINASSNRILRLGDRGEQVSALQESLAVAGFSSGATGIFDEATQNAVRRFQQAKGLTVDGVVGPQTIALLPAVGGSNPSSGSGNATSRLNIQALQRRLQKQGLYRGSIDGIWGPQTQAAVEAAQRAYDISASDIENRRF